MSNTSTRLVQIIHETHGRRVALVNGNELHLLSTYRSVYAFATAAVETGHKLRELLSTDLSGIVLDYDEVYALKSGWTFLPSFDHPSVLARCLVSGCANGPRRPGEEALPPSPPWFYKGNGMHLRSHGESLTIPGFGLSGMDEGEVVGIYLIDAQGSPRRIGFTQGNEFADPELVKRDARMASHAKVRTCSIGPELVLDAEFTDIRGTARVTRSGERIWESPLIAGEAHTQFPLVRAEQDLFQYEAHRVPGDAHVYYLGGSASSYKDNIVLQHGDQVTIEFEGFGRPLVNQIEREVKAAVPVTLPI